MPPTTSTPRIAVLMPCYNPGPDLNDTLDSLRGQSVPHRLYLVDDGSARPADYEQATAGMGVEIIRLPANLGITGAMNAGLQRIMAGPYEYIARIDCGDMATPERFARQIAYLDANPGIAIVGSAVTLRLMDASDNLLGERRLSQPLTPEACQHVLFSNSPLTHPAMMIRREVFAQLKAYSERFPAAEDYDLLWRSHQEGFRLANLPDVLLIKDETPGSISQKRRRRQIISRLAIQWENRDLTKPASWLGMVKSLVMLALPAWLANLIKSAKR